MWGRGGGSSSEGRGGKWYHIGQWVFELEEGPGVERMGLENWVGKFLKRKEWRKVIERERWLESG